MALELVVKNPSANSGDSREASSIPSLGKAPGVGNGTPLQYLCLENSRAEEPGTQESMGPQRVGHD